MLNRPLLIKKIIKLIKINLKNFYNKTCNKIHKEECSNFIKEFNNLKEDELSIYIKAIESSQSANIIKAIEHKDPHIYVHKLGVFYIKYQTVSYYNALETLKENPCLDSKEIKEKALEISRKAYINQSFNKSHGKRPQSLQ